MTKKTQLSAAAGCVAFAIGVVMESLKLQFYTKLGPGPGFFPCILGGLFGLCSIIWLIQIFMENPENNDEQQATKTGLSSVIVILVGLAAVAFLMDIIGFQLSLFLFLFILIKFLGEQKLVLTTIISIFGSVGVYYLFSKLLDLALPNATILFLGAIGL